MEVLVVDLCWFFFQNMQQLLAERKQINYKETNEQKAKEAAEDALALQKAQRRQRDWELCDKSRQNQVL